MSVQRCRDCGDPIELMRVDPTGRVVPVDVEPEPLVLGGPFPDGTPRLRRWFATGTAAGGLRIVRRVSGAPAGNYGRQVDAYVDHRARCERR